MQSVVQSGDNHHNIAATGEWSLLQGDTPVIETKIEICAERNYSMSKIIIHAAILGVAV